MNSEIKEPSPQWKESASTQCGSGNMSCAVIESCVFELLVKCVLPLPLLK